jgi:hypothetical protein
MHGNEQRGDGEEVLCSAAGYKPLHRWPMQEAGRPALTMRNRNTAPGIGLPRRTLIHKTPTMWAHTGVSSHGKYSNSVRSDRR